MPRGMYTRTNYHNNINATGHTGLKQTLATAQKRSQALRGRIRSQSEIQHASEGLKRYYANHPDIKTGKNNPMYGKSLTSEHKAKLSQKRRILWTDPQYRNKMVKLIMKGWRVKPNKPEQQIIELLSTYFLNEWKYVGDGQLIIGGLNPDFANGNSKKQLIEHFGKYWHTEQDAQDRINHFRQYGYNTLIIWESELQDTDTLLAKILVFNSGVDGVLLDKEVEL